MLGAGVALSAPFAVAQRAPEVLSVEAAQTDQYTRLTFRAASGAVTATPIADGAAVDLLFPRTLSVDLAELRSTPPRFLRAIERLNRPDGRLALRLTLQEGVRFRQFNEAGAQVIDLLAPSDQGPPPAQVRGPVQITETRDATEIRVIWSRPVRASVFQRGEAAWMVFDQAGALDVRASRRAGRRHSAMSSVAVQDGVALRVALSAESSVSARTEGGAWILRLANDKPSREAAPVRRDLGADGRGRLVVDFGRDGVVRTVRDPVLEDTFLAGLLDGPIEGVDVQRSAPEAIIAPSVHGSLIAMRAPNVTARFESGALIVSSAPQAATSVTANYTPKEASLGVASRLDLTDHQNVPEDLVLDRRAELERRAAMEGMARGSSARARMELARFLIAHELSAEALGALKVAAINQPQLTYDPGYRLMRGVANAMLGRTKDAEADLGVSGLANDPVAALWRGYVAGGNGNWEPAQRNLERGRDALQKQSKLHRARFLTMLSEAAIANRDFAAAAAITATAEEHADQTPYSDKARLLRAMVTREGGDARAALDVFNHLMQSRDELTAARAALEALQTQRILTEVTPEAFAEGLERLRFRWRGDSYELAVNQALGALYVQLGRWRDGLDVMRASANRFPDHPIGRQLRIDMATVFEALFMDGDADKLEPIQALALYYDFKELTPIGPNGDRLVRALAGRLVGLDLLDQAAELLAYQVEQRLDGMAKAQIASDLALIHLQNGKAERALGALASTRQPRMPANLLSVRRILEAKAQLELGREDVALELVERDRSLDAQRLRADIAWRSKDWPRALSELRALAALAPQEGALSDADRAVILRAGIAAAMADDRTARANLRQAFTSRMAGSPDADGFDIVTSDLEVEGVAIRELADRIAQTDLLDRFMQDLRNRLGAPKAATAPTQPPS